MIYHVSSMKSTRFIITHHPRNLYDLLPIIYEIYLIYYLSSMKSILRIINEIYNLLRVIYEIYMIYYVSSMKYI